MKSVEEKTSQSPVITLNQLGLSGWLTSTFALLYFGLPQQALSVHDIVIALSMFGSILLIAFSGVINYWGFKREQRAREEAFVVQMLQYSEEKSSFKKAA